MLKNEPMTQENQPTLTPKYIASALRRLEDENHMSSEAFAEARAACENIGVHEDDIAEWEYLLQVKAEFESFLRESYFRVADDAERENVGAHRHALAA